MSEEMKDVVLDAAKQVMEGCLPTKTGDTIAKLGNVSQLEKKREHDAHDRGLTKEALEHFERVCKKSQGKSAEEESEEKS